MVPHLLISGYRIQNPLAGMTREELLKDVDNFAKKHSLTDMMPLLHKAALVAQRPTEYDDIPEITEEERYHLRRETTHKWRHPLLLYLTIITCSIGACVQ
jgi:hypothetical protein